VSCISGTTAFIVLLQGCHTYWKTDYGSTRTKPVSKKIKDRTESQQDSQFMWTGATPVCGTGHSLIARHSSLKPVHHKNFTRDSQLIFIFWVGMAGHSKQSGTAACLCSCFIHCPSRCVHTVPAAEQHCIIICLLEGTLRRLCLRTTTRMQDQRQ
jgi:hypothetical protein